MFETLPVYRPDASTQTETLKRIGERVASATGLPIASTIEVGTGQNPSYKVFVEGNREPRYFVKIVAHKGILPFQRWKNAAPCCARLASTQAI